MKRSWFVLSLILIWFYPACGQGKWELKKNDSGIQVYTRKAAKGNVKEVRVLCDLDATKAQLINTLQNIADYSSWVYSNKKSTVLKMVNSQNIIYYTESHLPWPIKDRDLVIELNILPTPDVLNIQAKSVPNYSTGSK